MKVWLVSGFFVLAFATAVNAEEQPAPLAVPLPSLSAVTFNYTGKDPKKEPNSTYVWRRPTEVSFILVSACGGGGGGRSGARIDFSPTGGGGGRAAQVTTTMVGPLSAPSYKIIIPQGGVKNGDATELVGSDGIHLTFPGGSVGEKRPKGAAGSKGEASVYGAGGAAGGKNKNGAKASSVCAGGGGGGINPDKQSTAGGRGGDGFLIIYPLPNVQRLMDYVSTLAIQTQ